MPNSTAPLTAPAAITARRVSTKPNLARGLRRLHRHLGVFFAPALAFFAFTGALQTWGLQEAPAHPPIWLQRMANLHKHQSIALSPPRTRSGNIPSASPKPAARKPSPRGTLPARLYFTLVAASLFVSVLTGVFMALRPAPTRRRYTATLLAGIAVPVVLVLV